MAPYLAQVFNKGNVFLLESTGHAARPVKTGQGDRHGGNYFIHKDDNGQCFGALLIDLNGIRRRNCADGFRGTNTPLVIDIEMAAALRSLTPDALGKLLGSMLKPADLLRGNLFSCATLVAAISRPGDEPPHVTMTLPIAWRGLNGEQFALRLETFVNTIDDWAELLQAGWTAGLPAESAAVSMEMLMRSRA